MTKLKLALHQYSQILQENILKIKKLLQLKRPIISETI